jgi:hypothetical protein
VFLQPSINLEAPMLSLDDAAIIEGETETEEPEYFEALQRAINGGDAWRLQGAYGRAMMRAIEAGACLLGPAAVADAYGNPIPSRHEVEPGTKGSRDFVANARGDDWADRMAAIQ